ncbi:hypothetical protein PV648_22935 [Streptomyces sp. ID05-47C]|nr:hypothetical protein [Streptomyces sp. ID05-47C]
MPAEDLAKYDLSSRSAKGHRTQIREALGFRPATRADEERLTGWLADEVCPVELGGGPAARGPARAVPQRPYRASGPYRADRRSWPSRPGRRI